MGTVCCFVSVSLLPSLTPFTHTHTHSCFGQVMFCECCSGCVVRLSFSLSHTILTLSTHSLLSLVNVQDIRVALIEDGHDTDTEVLSAGSAQVLVVAGVVVEVALAKHGQVLDLGLSKTRGVGRDDDHLSDAVSDVSQCLSV